MAGGSGLWGADCTASHYGASGCNGVWQWHAGLWISCPSSLQSQLNTLCPASLAPPPTSFPSLSQFSLGPACQPAWLALSNPSTTTCQHSIFPTFTPFFCPRLLFLVTFPSSSFFPSPQWPNTGLPVVQQLRWAPLGVQRKKCWTVGRGSPKDSFLFATTHRLKW